MKGYSQADWRAYRREVIRLDGGCCTSCGREEDDGVVLQVHHERYIPGLELWEHPFDLCKTLCKGCHAREHGIIPPNFGWEFGGHNDLEDLIGSCDLCGTSIRHVFLIYRPPWPSMEVGEICCDHLTCSEEASNHMESIRRFNERRRRFVGSTRWTMDAKGVNSIRQKGIDLAILPLSGTFKIRMNGAVGKLEFPTLLQAMCQAFELIEDGSAAAYLDRRKTFREPRRSAGGLGLA